MSKSILVIDTPECCGKCPCFLEVATDCCGVSGEDIDSHSKPDWCPLRDLPEKKDMEPGKTIIRAAQHEGWNMCIDEILKGANGNDEGTV